MKYYILKCKYMNNDMFLISEIDDDTVDYKFEHLKYFIDWVDVVPFLMSPGSADVALKLINKEKVSLDHDQLNVPRLKQLMEYSMYSEFEIIPFGELI